MPEKSVNPGRKEMNRVESAVENIATRKMNCAQSVLTAFCDELGLDRSLAVKLAMGFGGGMGRTGRTCGAVTGAYMALGLKYKYQADKPQENKDRVYQLVRDFDEKFKRAHGSTLCKDLLSCDVSTPQGSATANEKGLFVSLCPKFVRTAVEIVEKM
jgi:C_GCAxxG_C_C family probable redox protein